MAFVSSAQIVALHDVPGAVTKPHHQSLGTVLKVPTLDGADILRFVVRFVVREHWEDKVVKYPHFGNYEGIMKLFMNGCYFSILNTEGKDQYIFQVKKQRAHAFFIHVCLKN